MGCKLLINIIINGTTFRVLRNKSRQQIDTPTHTLKAKTKSKALVLFTS